MCERTITLSYQRFYDLNCTLMLITSCRNFCGPRVINLHFHIGFDPNMVKKGDDRHLKVALVSFHNKCSVHTSSFLNSWDTALGYVSVGFRCHCPCPVRFGQERGRVWKSSHHVVKQRTLVNDLKYTQMQTNVRTHVWTHIHTHTHSRARTQPLSHAVCTILVLNVEFDYKWFFFDLLT